MTKLVILILIINVFNLGICDQFVFKKIAFSQTEIDNEETLSEYSPFGICSPKVPDRLVPLWMKTLPAGYDRPEDVYNVGARWARYGGFEGLTWELLEREKGKYDWSRTDYMFSQAHKAGLNLVVVLMCWNHLDQPDARIDPTGASAKIPNDMSGYLKFLEKAVERYDGDGFDDAPGSPVINYWEVENEVDFEIFWSDTPENYAKLLKESYKIIKKANPNAKVLIAGMAAQPHPRKSYDYYSSILKELDRIKDNPNDKYFDIFSFHLYNFDKDLNVITTLDKHISAIKKELLKYGYNVPFWMTETGDYSGSPLAPPGVKFLPKTEKEQAVRLFKIYTYSIAHNIKKAFWLTLTEWLGYGGVKNGVWDNVGLINNLLNDGESHKKLAYYTYRKMVDILEGSDWNNIQTIQERDGIYIYKFTKQGKPIWVTWNDNSAARQITISDITSSQVKITEAIPNLASGKEVVDYSAAFKTEIKAVSDGRILVLLGSIPVFIGEY